MSADEALTADELIGTRWTHRGSNGKWVFHVERAELTDDGWVISGVNTCDGEPIPGTWHSPNHPSTFWVRVNG